MPRAVLLPARGGTPVPSTAKTQVFDLDFVDRDGRQPGREFAKFTVKRAPREAFVARGSAATPPGCCTPSVWQELPPLGVERRTPEMRSAPGWSPDSTKLAAALPGCIPFDRTTNPEPLGQLLTQAQERGDAVLRHRVAQHRTERRRVEALNPSSGSRPRSPTCSAPWHALQADQSLKLPNGLWIITERAVATNPGNRLTRVQAALWGLGRTIVNEEPSLRCRLVDHDGSEGSCARWPICSAHQAHPSRNLSSLCGKESYWRPGYCHGRASGHLAVPRGNRLRLGFPRSGARSTTSV